MSDIMNSTKRNQLYYLWQSIKQDEWIKDTQLAKFDSYEDIELLPWLQEVRELQEFLETNRIIGKSLRVRKTESGFEHIYLEDFSPGIIREKYKDLPKIREIPIELVYQWIRNKSWGPKDFEVWGKIVRLY